MSNTIIPITPIEQITPCLPAKAGSDYANHLPAISTVRYTLCVLYICEGVGLGVEKASVQYENKIEDALQTKS